MKVLKSLALSALTASALMAQTNLCVDSTDNGWHLKGATNDITVTELQSNSNIDTVWTYDHSNSSEPWTVYSKDENSTSSFTQISTIPIGQGFWVMCNDGTYVDDDSTDDNSSSPDIVTESTTAQIDLTSDFSNHISFNMDDFDWFDKMSKTGTYLTFSPNEYEESSSGTASWTTEEERSYDLSNINATQANVKSTYDGGEYNLTIGTTEKITSIDGTSYSDLYLTNLSIKVVTPGDGWTDVWDWAPKYWDGTQEITVKNNDQMLDMFLIGNNWFTNDYAMLDGTSTDTTGDVVQGVIDTSETNYTKVDRTNNIIGSWEINTYGLHITLPDETMTMNIISSSNTSTGYALEVKGLDKVGSVWNEQMLWGSDATVTLIKDLIEQYNQ
ncbi:MAG: hypothetical protein ACQERD_07010 [Campylobacterota bacterium]